MKTSLQYLISAEEKNIYDIKDFVWGDDDLATHYRYEPATALLAVRNTQNEDLEDEEEEEEEEGEAAAGEQDISTKIHTHEQDLHCISEVIMQFVNDSNSSNLLEPLYTVKDRIQKDMTTKKVEKSFIGGSVEEISIS
jgi:hypothetical protein